jgi:hypothetical protein
MHEPKIAKRGNSVSQANKTNVFPPRNSSIGQIFYLQTLVGNREVERLLKSEVSQAELAGGPSASESVFQPSATTLQTDPVVETDLKTGRSNYPGNVAFGEIARIPPVVREVLRSPGKPLDSATRAFMEPRFRHSFSHIRIHTDGKAAESARSVSALAYTVGHNVVFGENKYAPTSDAGRELLAHELAHAIQQRNARGALLCAEQPGIFESSAVAAGRAIFGGRSVSRDLPACGLQIQRAPASEDRWKNDVNAARYRGQLMANRIRRHGKVSREARAKINEELAYFEGAANEVYAREVKPALAPFVEIEMPAIEMRPEPTKPERAEKEREYEGIAAHYKYTRESQLEAAAAVHAKFREGVPKMTAEQIYSNWEAEKENFIKVASSPNHGLDRDQLLIIYTSYWSDRWKTARSDLIASEKLKGADRLAAKEAAEGQEDFVNVMVRSTPLAAECLSAAEQLGRHLTLDELNKWTLDAAGFHEALVAASQMLAVPSLKGPGYIPPRARTMLKSSTQIPRSTPPPPPTPEPKPAKPQEKIAAQPPEKFRPSPPQAPAGIKKVTSEKAADLGYRDAEHVRTVVTDELSRLKIGMDPASLPKQYLDMLEVLKRGTSLPEKEIVKHVDPIMGALRYPKLYGDVMADTYQIALANNLTIEDGLMILARKEGLTIKAVEQKAGILEGGKFFGEYASQAVSIHDLPFKGVPNAPVPPEGYHGSVTHIVQDLVINRARVARTSYGFRQLLAKADRKIAIVNPANGLPEVVTVGDYVWRSTYDLFASGHLPMPEMSGAVLKEFLKVR